MSEEEFILPEITPQELAEWLKTRPELVLLDVREPYEFPAREASRRAGGCTRRSATWRASTWKGCPKR